MLSLVVCRCLFRLMTRCFLGRWICLLVSERFRLEWKCRLFGCNTYIQFCVHWHGSQSWRQHPTRHQLYGHLPPITKTIQVRRTRHAGHCWRSKDDQWCTPMDPHIWPRRSRTTSSNIHTTGYMWIRDVSLKTCQKQWIIGRSSERSGISVLAARHDDDDN